jgi:anti-anti-sigma factor
LLVSKPVALRASAGTHFVPDAAASSVAPFAVSVRPHRDAVHVAPSGELDIATVGALREQVDELVDAGFERVVVDLRELAFMDCAGLRLLHALNADAQRRGWELSLIQGRRPVRRVFEITETLQGLPFA